MPQGAKWTEIKQSIAPTDKEVIKKHRRLFYYYLSERDKIRRRRARGLERPWTKDTILDQYHFTNVYRRYDYGTQWLLEHVEHGSPKKREIVWRVIQYRLPNYPGYFEEHGWIPFKKFDAPKLRRRLERMKEQGKKWHTSAHIVLQSNFAQSRIENYVGYLQGIHDEFDKVMEAVDQPDMESCFKKLVKLKGIGGFTGYEILIDLCYIGVLPKEYLDQFANPGPGCKEGIDVIFPDRTKTSYAEAMRILRDEQKKMFRKYGFKAPPYQLTLQDIEFSLCEYSKYVKILHGTGKGRRYKPRG